MGARYYFGQGGGERRREGGREEMGEGGREGGKEGRRENVCAYHRTSHATEVVQCQGPRCLYLCLLIESCTTTEAL